MNLNLITEQSPENRVETLDYYHAAEHIWSCANRRGINLISMSAVGKIIKLVDTETLEGNLR